MVIQDCLICVLFPVKAILGHHAKTVTHKKGIILHERFIVRIKTDEHQIVIIKLMKLHTKERVFP